MNKSRNIYSVPEGYFEQLSQRLQTIPEQQEATAPKVVKLPFWGKVGPYVAMAACMVAAVMVGNFFLGKSVPASTEDGLTLQDYYYSDLIPRTDPYSIYDSAPDTYVVESSSEEDVLQYLISSGTSVDYIAYLINQ